MVSRLVSEGGQSSLTHADLLPHEWARYSASRADRSDEECICDKPGCFDLRDSPLHTNRVVPEVRTTKIIYEVTVRGRDGQAHALAEAVSRATADNNSNEFREAFARAGIMISPPLAWRGDQVEYKIAFFVEEVS